MIQNGQDIYIHFAGGTNLRVLHAAKTISRVDDIITVNYTEPDEVPTEPAESMTVFFHGPAEFMQQPGEHIEFENDEGEMQTGIKLIGEPVSAESRKCFRVSTVLAEYKAKLGNLGSCKLVDVSAAGVGFLTDTRLALGDSIDIEMTLAGKTCKGKGFIQSVKEIPAGYRYGLLCTGDKGAGDLPKGLQRLTMDAQRTQLRRLSGAA
ncbi:hypothetical protein MNBD_PLANCTO03-1205 [hydrothermal vent metagenome]|uniref:PilZ domain-containing protein n=1 Tax=hydrothermal vent metagenome TaxID=652676 RepID=A0A3B1E5T1_9ZZZZ